ncbi:hypothetical protein [Sorangium sp. So ce131]|uniref:hypothetical protein n=1 Tax=Sorangium sp. So ce131 TaxID=3133282 RepID=UPI003F60D4E3
MKRIWQGAFAAAAIGAATMFVLERGRQQEEIARMRDDMGALSRDLDEARSEAASAAAVRRLARRIEAAERTSPAPPPAPEERAAAPTQPGDEPEGPAAAEQRTATMAEVSERLQDVFAGEGIDAQWTAAARETARDKLSAALPDSSSLRSLECRSSMCRIETEHADLEQFQRFVQGAFMDPQKKPWNGGFFAMPVSDPSDGKVVVVSYLAREGEPLPMSL